MVDHVIILWAIVALQVFLYATARGAFILGNLLFCVACAIMVSVMAIKSG